ncbi:YwiC-like family protein [Geothrix oryzisoli]|uniref:YwiC-like family protein n=1 Tax=Geothrix oryzisoli TaxID=2922721 RepID=UPI001FAE5851|nr:YwiC-like family protein [Geothrix oryzisoli]
MSRSFPPIRTLLPAEHGSWFMLGFPLVLGLLLRPSWPGLSLGVAALAFFLARPPLRRVLTGQRDPLQVRALLMFGCLAGTFGALALWLSGLRFLIPLVFTAPLVILALRADLQRAVRSLAVELAAQGAFAGLAAAIVVAGGGSLPGAGRTWLLVTLLGGANLAHVRRLLGHAHHLAQEELDRRRIPVHALHLLLIAVSALLLAPRGTAGLVWTGWAGLLYLRALVPYRPIPARTLGWREGGLSALGLLLLWRALL